MAVLISITWVFPKIVVSQNGWFVREIPIKLDDLEVPLFLEGHPLGHSYGDVKFKALHLEDTQLIELHGWHCATTLSLKILQKKTTTSIFTQGHQPKQSSSSKPFSFSNIPFNFFFYIDVADLFLPLLRRLEGPWFPCWICPKPPGPMLWKLTPWRWSRDGSWW